MDGSTSSWKDFFCNWPDELPRRGILVTSFDEQIAFVGFLTSESLLLLERRAPDAVGARTVLLPYDKVTALKIADVVKPKMFVSMGFGGSVPKK